MDKTYKAIVAALDPSELVMLDWQILNWLRSAQSATRGRPGCRSKWLHADLVWDDEMYGIDQRIPGEPDERHTNKPYMDMMWATTLANSGGRGVIQVFRNWNRARTFTGTVENDCWRRSDFDGIAGGAILPAQTMGQCRTLREEVDRRRPGLWRLFQTRRDLQGERRYLVH